MKAGLLTIAALAAVATAVPAVSNTKHRHARHARRDDVEVVTEVDVVTAIVAQKIVYVNTVGVPISTSYKDLEAMTTPAATPDEEPATSELTATASSAARHAVPPEQSTSTPDPAPAPAAGVPAPAPVAESPTAEPAPAPEAAPTPAPAPATADTPTPAPATSPDTPAPAPATSPDTPAPAPAISPDTPSTSNSGNVNVNSLGLSYTPYGNNGACKTQSQMDREFALMSAYGMVRIYGTDCDQTAMVLKSARAKNMKVFAGVYDITKTTIETQRIIDAAAGNWDDLFAVSVGNELVNNKVASVDAVVAAIKTAREMLTKAGFPGKIVTVDTFIAIKNNPSLCAASDFAAVNCHAFFDGGVASDKAGDFVAQQAKDVSDACGGKQTFITETGWPWQGEANGKAIPSPKDQAAAINSIKAKFSSNLILFTAFDELWKSNAVGTFNAEQHWGIMKG